MILKPKIFADRIFYFESIVPNPDKIIADIEETDSSLTGYELITPWMDWKTNEEIDPYVFGKQKQINKQYWDNSSNKLKNIVETLEFFLHKAGMHYAKQIGFEYFDPYPISISKYSANKSMGPHVDSYDTPGVFPIMSAVMYLNDCDGGELNFPNHNILIKPKAGSIVIFPSVAPFFHESTPVKSGWKYIAPVFWVKKV